MATMERVFVPEQPLIKHNIFKKVVSALGASSMFRSVVNNNESPIEVPGLKTAESVVSPTVRHQELGAFTVGQLRDTRNLLMMTPDQIDKMISRR